MPATDNTDLSFLRSPVWVGLYVGHGMEAEPFQSICNEHTFLGRTRLNFVGLHVEERI